jgi:hypothetical protein
MKSIIGYSGIKATCHSEKEGDSIDSAVIELDSDARDQLDFDETKLDQLEQCQ